MTIKEADKIIKAGQPVTVHNSHFNETFTTTFIYRDRYYICSADGNFERADLEIVE